MSKKEKDYIMTKHTRPKKIKRTRKKKKGITIPLVHSQFTEEEAIAHQKAIANGEIRQCNSCKYYHIFPANPATIVSKRDLWSNVLPTVRTVFNGHVLPILTPYLERLTLVDTVEAESYELEVTLNDIYDEVSILTYSDEEHTVEDVVKRICLIIAKLITLLIILTDGQLKEEANAVN